jgi:hypothetical protein
MTRSITPAPSPSKPDWRFYPTPIFLNTSAPRTRRIAFTWENEGDSHSRTFNQAMNGQCNYPGQQQVLNTTVLNPVPICDSAAFKSERGEAEIVDPDEHAYRLQTEPGRAQTNGHVEQSGL